MKNDILLFAIMFALAWIGYHVVQDRLELAAAPATSTDGGTPTKPASAGLTANKSSAVASARSNSTAASTTKETNSANDAKSAQRKTTQERIEKVLMTQVEDWNNGDLDGFMDAYWNDKELMISGAEDTTFGWAMAYANYRKRYPQGKMGTIEFTELKTEMAGKDSAFVTGRFVHQLPDKKVTGNFSLVMKLIYRQWKIVQDHTSVSKESQ